METKIEKLEDNKVKVTVTVDAKVVDTEIGSTYKDFAKKYNFPGFRKGKAPRPVIDNAFGKEAIMAQVTEDVINKTYPQVIEGEKLFPVGSPDFNDPGTVTGGSDFTFEFTQSVKPTYTLTSYDPVEIEIPAEGASDEEIDSQLNEIVDRYDSYEDADDSTAMDGETCADLAIVAKKEDGQEVAGLTSATAFYAPGTGIYSEDFGEQLKGMKKGESRSFELDIPKDEASVFMSDVAGQKIYFDVTCNSVKIRKKAELTDEWVKETFGFEGVDDMRARIADEIVAQKEEVLPRIKENACNLQLIERLNEEAPESMVEQTESELLQDFFTQLQRQGMTFDQFLKMQGLDSEGFKADVKRQAQDNVKQELALDAWAAHAGIEATDEEVTLEFERAGLDNPKQTEREWREQGRLYLIREGIIRRKAIEQVMDGAKIKEISVEEYAKKTDE